MNALRQLWNNLSSVILALLLAVAVWVAATLQADPFDVREFSGIVVTPVNQPENTVLFEGDGARVNIQVRAPQSVLSDLSNTDFSATMDLGTVELGVSTPVSISVTSSSQARLRPDLSLPNQSFSPTRQPCLGPSLFSKP
jgi:hypothetical protein